MAYHGYLSTLLGILSLKGVRCVIIWRTFKPFDLLYDVLSSLYQHNRHFMRIIMVICQLLRTFEKEQVCLYSILLLLITNLLTDVMNF